MIRLRQVCLVAYDRDAVVADLEAVFSLHVGYHDPHIGRLGLHNAVLPVGDQFLEVVAPITAGTTAERYLAKRGGPGGYMLIFQTDDFAAHRDRVDEHGIRIVADYSGPGFTDMQLHPADTGGTFMEIDQQTPPQDWSPAGTEWRDAVDNSLVRGIAGAEVGCLDPHSVAERWASLLVLDATTVVHQGGEFVAVHPSGCELRFTAAGQRGEGLDTVVLDVVDAAEVIRRARARGVPCDDHSVTIGGVRFDLGLL